jgi:hypothetical protein
LALRFNPHFSSLDAFQMVKIAKDKPKFMHKTERCNSMSLYNPSIMLTRKINHLTRPSSEIRLFFFFLKTHSSMNRYLLFRALLSLLHERSRPRLAIIFIISNFCFVLLIKLLKSKMKKITFDLPIK